jgi:hypothetical protein
LILSGIRPSGWLRSTKLSSLSRSTPAQRLGVCIILPKRIVSSCLAKVKKVSPTSLDREGSYRRFWRMRSGWVNRIKQIKKIAAENYQLETFSLIARRCTTSLRCRVWWRI